ncbi:hypothetical protein AKJ61_03025 [candidate division MSBL1 archaeon SCGC-AAA259B11]|uniref:Penicillin acylase family protein n=1 Tax=candidate division MSBL1 archaeon SCGC-AAA259B11 TaxID=1698260 RepID=A0A133U5B6_9EURY|nr:hypothetical protein AKJ61_03025 [candidate division MSBL1 archaeon SCGC-AAA259B11]
MGKLAKLIASIAITTFLTISLSIPLGNLPPFGDLLNPYNGIYETARLSVKPRKATIFTENVSDEVTVLRDNYGVPHIFAKTDEDLFYTLGYLHAQDRLFQMDMQRRMAKGELSEVLGKGQIKQDKKIRRIGLAKSARRSVEKMENSHLINLLRAYSAGVNKRISERNLPIEFKLLQYKPSKWSPEDTLAVAKLISWGLSGTLKSLELEKLVEKLGEETVWKKLFPEETPFLVPIHDGPYPYTSKITQKDSESPRNGDSEEILSEKNDHLSSFKSDLPLGSNNWIVFEGKSETKKPMLASDPHLSLSIPAVWYQTYLKSEEGYNTAGVTLPGVPVVLIGANQSIAWGLTNISADDTDFYSYQTNSDGNKYLYDEKWHSFGKRKETIPVKGSKDVTIVIENTIHGPIITSGEDPVAMKWTGHRSWTELKAMFKINKAKNLNEFKEGLQYWHSPPQNFAYADKHGNIALFSAGWFPIREKNTKGKGVLDGSDPKNDWKGFVSFEEIPHTVNPKKGHISSANQDPVGENYPYYIGRFFDPGYRGRRINELLSSKKTHGINDFKEYQHDIFSKAAESMLPTFLKISEVEGLNSIEKQALDILNEWDYEMRENDTAPLIWTIWEMKFFRNIFEDEYKQAGVKNLPLPKPILGEKLLRKEPNSIWFDNVYTPIRENRKDITIESFKEAIDFLSEDFGEDINKWKWGEVNKYYFEHLTRLQAFSRGPYPASGGRNTLKVAPSSKAYPDLEKLTENDKIEFIAKHGPS